VLLEHHRLAGSCLVITRWRTGTMAILVVPQRVGARLGNIRSRKNTKRFADCSSGTGGWTSGFKHDRSNRTSKAIYIETTLRGDHVDGFIDDCVERIFNSRLRHSVGSRVIACMGRGDCTVTSSVYIKRISEIIATSSHCLFFSYACIISFLHFYPHLHDAVNCYVD